MICGGPGSHRLRRRVVLAQFAEHRHRETHDLLRRSVAHLERVDLGSGHAEVCEELGPRRESRILHHVLLGIAGQRDASARVQTVDQHAHFEGREVLHLVDRDVSIRMRALAATGERADPSLPGAKQQRIVLRVELCVDVAVSIQP
jgi:hypothetical protein